MKVAVVIPTYGHWELTRRCLDALDGERARGGIGEVVIVDDAGPGDAAARAEADGRARVLRLPHNLGFGRAVNAGARRAGGDAVLVLNNDTVVRPGAIAALVRALDDPTVGIAGPRLVYHDGTLQAAGLGFRAESTDTWHLHGHLDADWPDALVARDYPALVGAVLLVRRTLWDALGGYDEGYRNGWEDLDLCLRAWAHGARVRYVPDAVVEHLEGASLGRTEADPRNRERFVERWGATLAHVPRIVVGESPAAALVLEKRPAGLEGFALAAFAAQLRAGYGARVTVVRSRIDAVRAHALAALDRRAVLDVGWHPSREPSDVAFVAPESARDAAVAAAADARQWWTPSARARDALLEAGVDGDRIRIVALGVDDEAFAPGERTQPAIATPLDGPDDPHVTVVRALLARADVRIDVLVDERRAARVRAAHPGANVVEIDAAGTALRAALAGARAFVAPACGDAYDLLLAAARSAGCAIVATPERARAAGLDPHLTAVAAEPTLAEAAFERTFAPAAVRDALAAITRADGVRRRRAVQGAARARELARVLEHGTIPGDRAAVDARAAAALRHAAPR